MGRNANFLHSYCPPKLFNVKTFGAVGDGITDDTAAINATLTMAAGYPGSTVFIPPGTYLVSCPAEWQGAIILRNNVDLRLSAGAEIKLAANDFVGCYIILGWEVSNIKIIGGTATITGDKVGHTGVTGEWGHAIALYGCSNIDISRLTIGDCWGDGVCLEASTSINFCSNIHVSNFVIDGVRRNGISVISAKNVLIEEGSIANILEIAPKAGIDLEPNNSTEFLENITLRNIDTSNCGGSGLTMWLELSGTVPKSNVSIMVENFVDSGSVGDMYDNFLGYMEAGYNITVSRTDITLTNLFNNPDIVNTNGYSTYNASLAAASNILEITGSNGVPFYLTYQALGLAIPEGNILFYYAMAKVNNNKCSNLYIECRNGEWYDSIIGGGSYVSPPAQDTWYRYGYKITSPAGGISSLTPVCRSNYGSSGDANGSKTYLYKPKLFNLTNIFGASIPSTNELNVLCFAANPN